MQFKTILKMKNNKYFFLTLYVLLYPFAWLVYKLQKVSFGNYPVDLVCLFRTMSEHRLLSSVAFVESANFTSNVYKENNNFIGMHMPKVRKTLAEVGTIADGGATMARYKFKVYCALDFFLWLDTHPMLNAAINNVDASTYTGVGAIIQLFLPVYGTQDTRAYNSQTMWKYIAGLKYIAIQLSIAFFLIVVSVLVWKRKKIMSMFKSGANRVKTKIYKVRSKATASKPSFGSRIAV